MDASVSIKWWMKALEHTKRAEPAVKIANHYLYNNVKHYLAAAYTSMAVQMDYPVYCNLFINKLDYDYTRYHLDGIAQFYVGGYKQGLESCKKAIEYNEAIIKPIKDIIQVLTTEFIQTVIKARPKSSASLLECIHLAHSGHVQYISKLCNKYDCDLELEPNPHYSSEYIDYAKQGKIKMIMEYTNTSLRDLHQAMAEEKDTEKLGELNNKRQDILAYNQSLMEVGIHSLQTILQLDEKECSILNKLVMQAVQKNMYDMKLEADQKNLKFYNDKLDEIRKGKKEQEIVSALAEVEHEIQRQEQAQVVRVQKKNVIKKNGGKKKK
jgi:hypothetical protein